MIMIIKDSSTSNGLSYYYYYYDYRESVITHPIKVHFLFLFLFSNVEFLESSGRFFVKFHLIFRSLLWPGDIVMDRALREKQNP